MNISTFLAAVYGKPLAHPRCLSACCVLPVAFFAACLARIPCAAQVVAPSPLAVQAHADDFGPDSIEVPFVSKNNWIILDVKLGADPEAAAARDLHFLLDTGASDSALNEETYEAIKIELNASDASGVGERIVGTGDSSDIVVSKVLDAHIEVGGVETSAPVLVFPMGSELKGDGIDGVLGMDFIKKFVVYFDYKKRVVRFYDPSKFKAPSPDAGYTPVPLEIDADDIAVVTAEVTPFGYTTTQARLELDTGDDGAISLYSPYVARNKWQEVLAVTVPSVAVGVGGQSASRDGRLRDLHFGGTTLNQPPVSFSTSVQGAMADTEADGQLGGMIFDRFTTIIDYGRKILYLRPNDSARAAFPVMLYYGFAISDSEKPLEECIIDDVDPGSPIALAGITLGETLYTIDGRRVAGLSNDALTQLLDASGDDRVFEVSHNGEPHRFVKIKPVRH